MKLLKTALLGSILIFLASCTTWVKPGADQSDFNRESSQCQTMAYQQFPVVMSTPRSSGTNTQCYQNGNYINCNSQPSYGTMNLVNQMNNQSVDVNVDARNTAYRSCMYSQGWSQQQK